MLVFKISPHGSDLAVPEVQFVFLRALLLEKHVDFLLQTLICCHLICKLALQVIDFILKHFTICIESSLKVDGPLLIFAGLHGSTVYFFFLMGNLLTLDLFLFYPLLLICLKNDKLILSTLQHFLGLGEILSEGGILERKLIDLHFHGVILRRSHVTLFISFKDIDLSLQLIVLLVEEIDLILQFGDTLLVLLILVLEVDFLKVLCGCIQIVKSEDLVIAHFHLLNEVLGIILLINQSLLELLKHLDVLFAPLVGFPDFRSPLVLVNENGLLNTMSLLRGIWTALHRLRFLKST